MRGGYAALVALGLAAAVSACGGKDESGDADPARAVPQNAAFYAEVDLHGPRADRASRAIRTLTGESPSGLGKDLLARSRPRDISYARDIRPWVGDRAGVFQSQQREGPGLVVAVADEAEARAALGRLVGEGKLPARRDVSLHGSERSAWAVFSGLAAIGSGEAVRASVDSLETGGLDRLAVYRRKKRSTRNPRRFGHVYVDVGQVVRVTGRVPAALGDSQRTRRELGRLKSTVGMVDLLILGRGLGVEVDAQRTTLAKLQVSPKDGRQSTRLFDDLPDGPAAVAFNDFGPLVASLLEDPESLGITATEAAQADRASTRLSGLHLAALAREFGDVGLFLERSTPASGGLVMRPRSGRLFAVLRRFALALRSAGNARVTAAPSVVRMRSSGLPETIELARRDGKLALTYGTSATAALKPQVPFRSLQGFQELRRELGRDYSPTFVVSLDELLPIAQAAFGRRLVLSQREIDLVNRIGTLIQGERIRGSRVAYRTALLP